MNTKKKTIFKGAATALVTPFSGGEVDYIALERLIESQIKNRISALVVCGTTGEAPVLSDEEKKALYEFTAEKAAGRVPVIAGTGSPSTAKMLSLSKAATEAGCDALLIVTPYYNKGTERGVIESYLAAADLGLPVIIYNVPSRTGLDLPVETLSKLSRHENIAAIKEACGNIDKIARIRAEIGDLLAVYSGNDSHIVPVLSLGGLGVISVLSNIMPLEVSQICSLWERGDHAGALSLQLRLTPLIRLLFAQTNPAPIKYACELLNICSGEMRLPFTEIDEYLKKKLQNTINILGFNV